MEEDLTPQEFRNLLEKIVQDLQGSESDDGVNPETLATVLKQISFFHKYLEQPANIHDFVSLAKLQLNYEVYPSGSVLQREGDYSEKLCIILKGSVQKLLQRRYEDIEKEIRKKNPKAFKDGVLNKNELPRMSLQKYNPRYLQHTAATKKKTVIGGKQVNQYIVTLNKLTDISEVKSSDFVNAKGNQVKTLNNLDMSNLNKSLNEVEWDEQLSKDNATNSDSELPVPTKSMVISKLKRGDTFKSSNFKKGIITQQTEEFESPSIGDLEGKENQDNNRTTTIGTEGNLDKRKEKDALAMTEEDVEWLHQIVETNPDLRTRIFLSDIIRVQKGKIFKAGDSFGENFFKDNRPKENSILAVASEELHMLTFTRESYQDIMDEIKLAARDKAQFFLELLPSFDEETVRRFSYHFSEKQLKKKETIYEQNDIAQELYLLKSGDVRLLKTVDYYVQEGTPQKHLERAVLPVASIIKQQFFGEELLLKEGKRLYTAVTMSSDSTAYFISVREHNKIKFQFEELLRTLKNQAQERFNWRQQRVVNLIEQKKKKPVKPAKAISTQSLSITKTKSESFHALHPQFKKLHDLSRIVYTSSDDDTQPDAPYSLTVKHNKALVLDKDQNPKTLEIYKSKFSRKTKVVEKALREENFFKKKGEDYTSKLLAVPNSEEDLIKFNVRKELHSKKPSKLRLPAINTPQSLNHIVKSTKSSKNNLFKAEYFSGKPNPKQVKSYVLDNLNTESFEEAEPTIPQEKSKLKDITHFADMPSRMYGLIKKIEDKPSSFLFKDPIATIDYGSNVGDLVNYHAVHKVKLPKKFAGGFNAKRKVSEEIKTEMERDFSMIVGKKHINEKY